MNVNKYKKYKKLFFCFLFCFQHVFFIFCYFSFRDRVSVNATRKSNNIPSNLFTLTSGTSCATSNFNLIFNDSIFQLFILYRRAVRSGAWHAMEISERTLRRIPLSVFLTTGSGRCHGRKGRSSGFCRAP